MTDQKEPSEEQREFARDLLVSYLNHSLDPGDRTVIRPDDVDEHEKRHVGRLIAERDAAQFRRGVEAAIAIVERHYFAAESLAELRNLRGDDDG